MVPADADAIADLTTQLGYPSSRDDIAERFAKVAARDDSAILVATDAGGSPIGWVHVVRLAQLEATDVAMIAGLVVGDGHRSAGIGAELLDAAEVWASEHGARTMSVRSRTTREAAHRFYERHGYVRIKVSHVFEKPLGKG